MEHMMHLDQHQQCGDQRDATMATAGTRSSASASVSQVAFVLIAVAFISLFSSSFLGGAAAAGASSSSLPSGAALSARLAALCGFVTTKKALFVLSNAIFLFLAADCRCFFPGVSSMATPSTNDDDVVTASRLPPCAVEARPCSSYSGNLYYCYSNTEGVSANCSGQQGKRAEVPESAGLHGGEANVTLETVVIVEEPTRGGEAHEEELEKLEMDELNRKFEDFIQSRRVKWLREEEQVLQCQQQQVV
ncbi:unnamed protein product [Triticum turgidum subsp. durum]|uniref:Uncharacterized protein n=1 Tax=Triticum turgidum subsp. durum TaxID=4567 RepID=A0A9R1PER8_TRITD|nr:unnamed protein product [Triticum turgidum subsp. durum]